MANSLTEFNFKNLTHLNTGYKLEDGDFYNYRPYLVE